MEAIINAYLHERIGYRDLIRKLIAFKSWQVPFLSKDDDLRPQLIRHNQQIFLLAYSDPTHVPADMKTMTVDGQWLFSQLEDPINTMVIDAQTPHALQFTSEKFSELRGWAQAVYIESLLAKEEFDAHTLQAMLDFDAYLLPLIDSESGIRHITLAPDNTNRKLAAVFTAEDALSLYIQNAQGALGKQVLIDSPNGHKLFSYLLELPIDGIVFNCYGPSKPRALSKESLKTLLKPTYNHES